MRRVSAALLASVLWGSAGLAGAQATFDPIGDVLGGAFLSEAFGMATDGSIVVGRSDSAAGRRATVWANGNLLPLNGVAVLPELPFDSAFATSQAPPGVIVGEVWDGTTMWAGIWGTVNPIAAWQGAAFGISADGTVVAGVRMPAQVPVVWNSGVVSDLNGNLGVAYAVSADGTTIVGQSGLQAFRHQGGVFGPIPGLEPASSDARAVSAFGNIIVGTYGGLPEEAYRWSSGVSQRLGGLWPADIVSRAFGVSGSGGRVVGESFTSSLTIEAFYWTDQDGMRNLKDVLETDFGLDLTGWTLERAEAISTDGTTIVGWGTNPTGDREGWVVRIPQPGEVCGDVDDDAFVDAGDVATLRQHLKDPVGSPLTPGGIAKCNVILPPRPCDLRDLVVLRRDIEGPLMPPGIAQVCAAAP